jgi:hypothetical protein
MREDILRVRNFHKNVTEKNRIKAQQLVAEAEGNVKRAKNTLEDFKYASRGKR